MNNIDISIVIVSYNVKFLLKDCLESIQKSSFTDYEVIVVDNDSPDKTIDFLEPKFPEFNFINTGNNLGFSKANNIGFENSKGKYILILNPDTILSENTLEKMYKLMEENPKIGASGCKVLNPDGSFQIACRRSFPTPWNSFTKLFGLQNLFPNSKLFSSYNLNYLDTNQNYEIDVLIGAFIFTRKSIIDQIGGFDEEFFMYGEDIDLCKRIKNLGYSIYYYSETSIVHLKGESTKRSSINENKHFYEAMIIYIKKNYKYSTFFINLIKLGISLRYFISLISKNILTLKLIFVDLIIITLSLLLANYFRFGDILGFPKENFNYFLISFLIINFLSNYFSKNYIKSFLNIKSNITSAALFLIFSSIWIYSDRHIDFSRIVLLLMTTFNFILSFLIRKNYKKDINNNQIIIIGNDRKSKKIINYIKKHKILFLKDQFENFIDFKLKYQNIIEDNILVISLEEKSKFENANTIIYIDSFEEFLNFTYLKNFGTHPEPLLYQQIMFNKRLTDILFSIIFLTIGFPFVNLLYKKLKFNDFINVLVGKYSFIGIDSIKNNEYVYKKSLISLAEIEGESVEDKNRLNQYYKYNYSLLLDFEILVKAFGGKR